MKTINFEKLQEFYNSHKESVDAMGIDMFLKFIEANNGVITCDGEKIDFELREEK